MELKTKATSTFGSRHGTLARKSFGLPRDQSAHAFGLPRDSCLPPCPFAVSLAKRVLLCFKPARLFPIATMDNTRMKGTSDKAALKLQLKQVVVKQKRDTRERNTSNKKMRQPVENF
jgi:hypothetical protein